MHVIASGLLALWIIRAMVKPIYHLKSHWRFGFKATSEPVGLVGWYVGWAWRRCEALAGRIIPLMTPLPPPIISSTLSPAPYRPWLHCGWRSSEWNPMRSLHTSVFHRKPSDTRSLNFQSFQEFENYNRRKFLLATTFFSSFQICTPKKQWEVYFSTD